MWEAGQHPRGQSTQKSLKPSSLEAIVPPVRDLIHPYFMFFCSSVRDGVHAAVSGEGQEIPQEEICVCGRSASVHSDRKTGESLRDIGENSLTLKRENRSNEPCGVVSDHGGLYGFHFGWMCHHSQL